MSDRTAGLVAGLLAGAAGATAHNAVNYLHQAVAGETAPASPDGGTPAGTAEGLAQHASGTPSSPSKVRALGPLGGLGIGVGLGAVAGALRSGAATPPQTAATAVLGAAAWAVSTGATTAAGTPRPSSPSAIAVDALSHLAYGAVTVLALHRLLDPRTPHAHR